MKITFVYPDIATLTPRPWTGRYYYGIGYLSAYLKAAGHTTSLIHLIRQPIEKEDVLARIRAEAPDLVAFSVTTHSFPDAASIAGWMREAGISTPTICGGVHATLNPEAVARTAGIDYACVGEGEEALAELCTRLVEGGDTTSIANIWSCRDGAVHRNEPRPLVGNLDVLPFPDREIFDYPRLYHQQEGEGEIIMSRGCPYLCTYCCNQALNKAATKGKDYVRFRTVDSVIAEIRELVRRYPFVRFIQFDDDLPFVRLDWTREFSEKYRRHIGLPFRFNLRPNVANRVQLQLLKEANAQEVKIGLESGNDEVRNGVLKRNLTAQQILDAFGTCRQLGIRTFSLNMVGLPHETPRAALDTIKMNARAKADICQVSIFHPYKGTPLYRECVEAKFLTDKKVPDFFSDTVLEMPGITSHQILFYRRYFRFMVYLYRGLYSLPPAPGKALVGVIDRLLVSKGIVRALRSLLDPIASAKRKVSMMWPARSVS